MYYIYIEYIQYTSQATTGLWWPLSMARLCSLSLYIAKDFLSFGSVTVKCAF